MRLGFFGSALRRQVAGGEHVVGGDVPGVPAFDHQGSASARASWEASKSPEAGEDLGVQEQACAQPRSGDVRLAQIGDGLLEGIECRGRAHDEESEVGLIGGRVAPKCP